MDQLILFRLVRLHVLTGLFANYYSIMQQLDPTNVSLMSDLASTHMNLLRMVDKKLYHTLQIKVRKNSSFDEILIHNSSVPTHLKDTMLLVVFDFSKETPTLNFKYVDTSLTYRIPDSFELEG